MGTEVRLLVVTDDARAGDESLLRAGCDLEETEQALSRFRENSELGRLNREGTLLSGERLLIALKTAARAYEWSDGLLDPRVIDSLEAFGYRRSLPRGDVGVVPAPAPLAPVKMGEWVQKTTGRITLPAGVRLDLAGVGKALGIGWAAQHLAGHMGLLVDVGGDVMALGHDERGEPWRIAVNHDRVVGEFAGSPLAVATSTTTRRAWKTAGGDAHHLIDPRIGVPSRSGLLFATVAAPTILEADLAAKLLVIGGEAAAERLDERYRIVVTDRRGGVRLLGVRQRAEVGA